MRHAVLQYAVWETHRGRAGDGQPVSELPTSLHYAAAAALSVAVASVLG
jgi:hypothetical protein